MAKNTGEMTPEATAELPNVVARELVERDAPIVTEFVDYIRWLADQDTGFQVTVGQLWMLWYEGVVRCRHWSEVCEDQGLPVREEWDS